MTSANHTLSLSSVVESTVVFVLPVERMSWRADKNDPDIGGGSVDHVTFYALGKGFVFADFGVVVGPRSRPLSFETRIFTQGLDAEATPTGWNDRAVIMAKKTV